MLSVPWQNLVGRVPRKASGRAIRFNLFCLSHNASKKDFRCYPLRKRHFVLNMTLVIVFSFGKTFSLVRGKKL
ncbi:MAG: hypothetical protein JWR72_3234 [Flavisolibacter sp.]|nr:hypothetical protein [Flavisolibacter sp.]